MKHVIKHIKEHIKKCDDGILFFQNEREYFVGLLEEIRQFKLKNFERR